MAFLEVRKVRVSGGIDKDGTRTYEEEWMVVSDRMDDSPRPVSAAGALASRTWWSAYPDDPNARLKEIHAEQTDDLNVWRVKLKYDSEFEPFDRSLPPEERPWHFDYGSVSSEELLVRDYTEEIDEDGNVTTPDGLPVVNSAGVPYDPPPSVPSSRPTIMITLFRMIAEPDRIEIYQNAVNDADFYGYPPDSLRVTEYKQSPQHEDEWGDFYQYTITLEYKSDGWNPLRVLDAGTVQIATFTNDAMEEQVYYTPILDRKSGSPVTSPVPLDGEGHELERLEGDDLADNLVYLEFVGYRQRDFTYLISNDGAGDPEEPPPEEP